jgi:aspartate racemase
MIVSDAFLPADMSDPRTATSAGGVIGVLGGMGPLATVDFLSKMLAATPATNDQEHVPLVVSAIPQVPDRTLAFRGEGESPLPAMVDSARRLKAAGAGLVVIVCNTAHLWFDELHEAVGLPMIHLVDAAIDEAFAIAGPGGRVGLLGTDATVASGLYINRVTTAAQPIQWLLPTAREMTELVMPGIEAVKAGALDAGRSRLAAAAEALKGRGATAVILGCTEIPVVLDAKTSPLPAIDATAALARRAVSWSRAQRAAS